MIFSSRSRSILAAYGWCGDLAKIARRSNAACSPPTATRSPTRCPPKPCSPCPNSTAGCRCPTRPCTLRRKQEGATQFPTIGLFERNANNFKGTRNAKAQKSWSSRDCGRDTHYWAPPAQNRTGSFPAYGSHLGCLTAGLRLPYALRRRWHAFPALCPARAASVRVLLGLRPSLHRLRCRSPGLVRRLHCYYGGVLLLMPVHHRPRVVT